MKKFMQTPGGRTAILAIVLILSGTIIVPLAYWYSALPGVWASIAAWSVCFLSGLLALWLVQRFNGPSKVLHQVLSSTFARMAIPLGAVLAVHVHGGTLADAGFVYYILAFYFITLTVETLLLAAALPRQSKESQPS